MKMKSFFHREEKEKKKEQRMVYEQKKVEKRLDTYGKPQESRNFIVAFFVNIVISSWEITTFVMLLMLYLGFKITVRILAPLNFDVQHIGGKMRLHIFSGYMRAIVLFDKKDKTSIKRIDLIDLAMKNMRMKKTRSIITIGGMAIGIGTIVFLVSLGYGLQQVVISRVARLDEMKQADISPQTGGQIKITDKTMASFTDFPESEYVLPLIAVVGKVTYKNSSSDVAVYGVTTDYLKQSAIKTIYGKPFESNSLSRDMNMMQLTEDVAGVSTIGDVQEHSIGEKIQNISYDIYPGEWVRVRSAPQVDAPIVGYTKRIGEKISGEEVWGDVYESSTATGTDTYGKWIHGESVPLWKSAPCEKGKGDCEDGEHSVLRNEDGTQNQSKGYFAQLNIVVVPAITIKSKVVLGDETDASAEAAIENAALIATAKQQFDGGLEFVEIASESATAPTEQTKKVALAKDAKREAVVNSAMVKLMGLKPQEAIGKTFTTSFIVVGDLLADPTKRVESASASYTIVGVTPDDKSPFFYVPFMDLRSLGIVNFSQVKLGVKNKTDLVKVRKQVEAMGYVTSSVADTVEQINSLFATVRTLLALLGMVALGVASLGMFNTLTVSLLERTHEVGLMKAMGMRSFEVKELFLTESMIMGFFGGIAGITFGFLAGKIISLILSLFAIANGVGYIDISYIPLEFVLVVVCLSLFVGIFTGFYPAKRATQISALDALRYE